MCNKMYSWSSDEPSDNPQFDERMKDQIDTLHSYILNSGVVKVIENCDSDITFEDLPDILTRGIHV